ARSGIVHSERVSDAPNHSREKLLGVQTWVALPEKHEEIAPAFSHHASNELPEIDAEGFRGKIILGEIFGGKSPVATLSNPVYADCFLDANAVLQIPADVEERSVYILSGSLLIDNRRFETGTMIVFGAGREAIIAA